MKVRVFGTPIPQGSTKAFAIRKGGRPTGRVVITSDNPRTKPWRQAIIDAWHGALASGDWGGLPVNGATVPLMVTVAFLMRRPKDHYGTGRNAAQVRPGAPLAPEGKPDIDKLCRSVLDALTDAGAWRDDAQVCSLHAIKAYPGPDEAPGAIIEVIPYAVRSVDSPADRGRPAGRGQAGQAAQAVGLGRRVHRDDPGGHPAGPVRRR